MNILIPEEMISEIYLFTDFITCVKWNRDYESKKLYELFNYPWNCGENEGIVTKWLHNNNKHFTKDNMDFAAYNGQMNVVRFLHYNRTEGCSRWAMRHAVALENLEMVRWLHVNKPGLASPRHCDSYFNSNSLNILRWFFYNIYESIRLVDYLDEEDLFIWLHLNRLYNRLINKKF